MKKTGELLKQGRLSSNLTLSEVALATKINPKVLTAIECGDEGNLPAKTFLKGFVRSYAVFLKMDVEDVLRSFVEDTGGPVPAPTHEAYQKQDPATQSARRSVPPEGSSSLRTAAIVVIVLLICAIIGVRELVDKYQRERMAASTPADLKVSPLVDPKVTAKNEPKAENKAAAKVEAPKAESAPVADVPERKADPVAKAEPRYEVEPSETVEPVAGLSFDAAFATPKRPILMSLSTGIPKTLEQPYPTAPHEPASVGAPVVVEEPVAEAPAAAAAPAEPVAPPAPVAAAPSPAPSPMAHEILIEALDQVQVKIVVGGETKTVNLAPNDVYTVRSNGAVFLDVSDGGAVSLVLNGRIQGVPGKLGEPKQVQIP